MVALSAIPFDGILQMQFYLLKEIVSDCIYVHAGIFCVLFIVN